MSKLADDGCLLRKLGGEPEEEVLSPQEPRTKHVEKSKRPAQLLEATQQ